MAQWHKPFWYCSWVHIVICTITAQCHTQTFVAKFVANFRNKCSTWIFNFILPLLNVKHLWCHPVNELWTQHAVSGSTPWLGQCYITLRLSWCTVSFPGFLTTAVTMWPCCSAWLTRYCPVCPVAPSTAIFILTLWRTELSQGWLTDNVFNALTAQANSKEVPSLFRSSSVKKSIVMVI